MAKRIIVCSDGTGNTAIKGRGTNVFKLFEAVDLNGHRYDPSLTPQIAIYDDGVGTENFKPLKVFAGATGWGLSRNVKHLYKELARVYDPGDEIYMFGFSRGAFTVRTLAGFIATCGLVDPRRLREHTFRALDRGVNRAYSAYRKCYRPWLWQLVSKPSKDAGREFKQQFAVTADVEIRFLGVWDTVDAVGLPFHISDIINALFYRFKFPDLQLTSIVKRACQALAIDDQRASFRPLLWQQSETDRERIEQVWFAGAHSNVGGGYPKQGMSLVALDWMLGEAHRAGGHGLRLVANDRATFSEHASVDDKLYDPRAGLGIFYRWKIRDIARLCADHGVVPKVHVSVLERVAHGTDDYAPGNVPGSALIVFTPPSNDQHYDLARQRALNVQTVLKTLPSGSLLPDVRFAVAIGVLSYYVYLVSCTVVILEASRLSPESLFTHSWLAISTAASLAWNLLSRPGDTLTTIALQLWQEPRLTMLMTAGFATSYILALMADRRMSACFSDAWFTKQPELRECLKRARAEAVRPADTHTVASMNATAAL
jgi:uncharacterized protein (DUF2235 family)